MSSPRIAYVSTRPIPSRQTDTQQVVKTVAALTQAGADVELIVPATYERETLRDEDFARVVREFYAIDGELRVRRIKGVPPSQLELERPTHAALAMLQLRRGRYDFVYTRSRAVLFLCTELNIPVVFETYRMLAQSHPYFAKVLLRQAKKAALLGVITHSAAASGSLLELGFPQEKLATIRNGFDPNDLLPVLDIDSARAQLGLSRSPSPAGSRPIVGYTGHVGPRKGMPALLALAERCPEADFLIVGGEPDEVDKLRAEIETRKLTHVSSVGHKPISALASYLYASDVLLIPTTAAPFSEHGRTVLPMKVFSYLAAGRAILAPRLPDVSEVLIDGSNARLVVPDDPDAAANALRELISEPALRDELGKGALASAAQLTWSARAQRLLTQIDAWRTRGQQQ